MSPSGKPEEKGITYELYYNKQVQDLQEANKYAELEKRIAQIEKHIGNWKESPEFTTMTQTVEFLYQMVQQLNPVLAEEKQRSLEKLIGELKLCLAQKSEDKLMEFDKGEIEQLYEMSQSALEYYKTLPNIVERLNALKYLHEQSAELMNRIATVEKTQMTIQSAIKEASELVEGVKQGLYKNMEVMQKNLAGMDERLSKLTGK